MKGLLLFILLFFSNLSIASHIVGGEVYYDSLGNDQYRITFEIYRDCSGAGFDSPLWYTVFNANGTILSQYSIALPTPDTLPVVYDDPCVTPPTDICIERAVYIDTITLPTTPDGYYISYQRCCWANNIQNITDPGDWGITITCNVPGSNLVSADNNCARFNNYPPIVLCSNNTLTFDHSATDMDGDSLVYSLCTPKTTYISVGAEPNPEASAPYADVPWEVGYSGTQPLGPGSNITIDPQTGMMDITPSLIGTFVAAVCVEEYRNGVLINEKSRTFGYRVVECDVTLPMQVDVISQGELVEGCSLAGFIVSRDDSTDALDIQLFISGTATNGVDYNFLPDTLTLPAGVGTDTISIIPVFDNLLEGDETIIFSVVIENPCENTFDTTTAYLTIVDYIPMIITSGDSLNLCDEAGEWGQLWCQVQNGVPPYSYFWNPTPYANNDTINFPATDLDPNLNIMSVNVYDACGQEISSDQIVVYNQCPVVVPNVFTPNNDGINDIFLLQNIDDYDRVELQIVNRWGNLIYEDDNYQNDWDGKTMNGNEIAEGVYFYIARPQSEKYEYDDAKKTIFTLHGFFHVIR